VPCCAERSRAATGRAPSATARKISAGRRRRTHAAQELRGAERGVARFAGTAWNEGCISSRRTTMKILGATDFGERAGAAARIAADLARRTAGSVELLHVVRPPPADILALGAEGGVFDDATRSDATARLEAEARALGAEGVAVTAAISGGDVVSAVHARAEAIGADLVVMGAHGRPALERFLLGSTAERTVRRATRPVLIVPPGVERLGRPDAGPLRVTLALDGRPVGASALDFVRALRARLAFDVTVLRLYWPMEEYARLGLTGARDLFGPDPVVIADLGRGLALEVGALPGAGTTTFAIEPTWGSPGGRILELARGQGSDLVVMGAESRRGLATLAHPPVARQVVRHAAGVPVVFIPASAGARAPAGVPTIVSVLAPTDLSAAGNRAVGYAYALLGGHGGVVELCHVHERPLPVPPYAYERTEGKLSDVERARIVGELRALIPPEAERLGVTTHVTVVDGGKAGEAIVQAVERLAVDAVVLGTHGRSGAFRSLLGSVSEHVVRHARRPVVVVPR
jgi:nucleotide-binding universal stress UspA family protein